MKKNNKYITIIIIFLFVLLFLIISITPTLNKFSNTTKLIINEVMPANKNTNYTTLGKHYDYIELYNGNNYDINLQGYFLSDNNFNTKKWMFPKAIIKANSYLLVYASGLDKYENGELHTNFKLDKQGEVLILSNNDAKVISKIFYTNCDDDISYGYSTKENDYVYFYNGTPLEENNSNYNKTSIKIKNSNYQVHINEYLINNNIIKNKDDNYYPIIELYNSSKDKINLKDFSITTDSYKYTFNDLEIDANSYLLVHLVSSENNILNIKDTRLIFKDNNKDIIDDLYLDQENNNYVHGYYNKKWQIYLNNSFGKENTGDYVEDKMIKDVIINEISYSPNAIELKNITNNDLNLKNYKIVLRNGKYYKLGNVVIKANGYYVINNKLDLNRLYDEVYLYKNNAIIDEFITPVLSKNMSCGRVDDKSVLFKNITLGKDNSTNYYDGIVEDPTYSINGGYVNKGTKLELKSNGDIYYTTDGSMPNKHSNKYTGPITINKTVVIKAISYKDNYLPSNTISRTFIVGRKSKLPIVSISSDNNSFFGSNGLISNYRANLSKFVNVEYYEADGALGFSAQADATMSGMDSRKRDQKSFAIYLRKDYDLKEVTYPLFKDAGIKSYSSFTLRNAGEDPKRIRIMDTALTYSIRNMNIDIQDYRSVIVYLNGEYYGLYNLRERFNGDYLETNYGIDKDKVDLIKYDIPKMGDTKAYDELLDYISKHNVRSKSTYDYLKTQIDMEELCNYWIVESFYGNTDLGNIRYYRETGGKWRWMLYDLDWAMWDSTHDYGYPTKYSKVPAATYLGSSLDIVRELYKNSEFKELYLTLFGKHLKEEFKPSNFNKIVDELAKEIEDEIPYHNDVWHDTGSLNTWRRSVNNFKDMYENRYNYVVRNLKRTFNLSNSEYDKYFGGL